MTFLRPLISFWSEQILDGMSVSNKRLKLADVLPRAWEQKAVGVTEAALAGDKEEDNDGEDHAMAEDGSGDENEKKPLEPYRNVTQVVTPLAHLPYEEQLGKKKEEIVQVLKRLVRPHTMSQRISHSSCFDSASCKFESLCDSVYIFCDPALAVSDFYVLSWAYLSRMFWYISQWVCISLFR